MSQVVTKRKKSTVVLTSRDYKIFQFLFEGRTASHWQIGRIFFKNCSKQVQSRRLSLLTKHKYLEKKGFPSHKNSLICYQLTNKSLNALSKHFKFKITNPLCKSDSVIHDLALNDIRIALKQFKSVKEIFTENVLQSCTELALTSELSPFAELNSDGVLTLDTPLGTFYVGLEYEASSKSDSRNMNKLNQYYTQNQVQAVFYISKNKSIQKGLMDAERRMNTNNKSKIFYCLLSDVMEGFISLTFSNVKGQKFILK